MSVYGIGGGVWNFATQARRLSELADKAGGAAGDQPARDFAALVMPKNDSGHAGDSGRQALSLRGLTGLMPPVESRLPGVTNELPVAGTLPDVTNELPPVGSPQPGADGEHAGVSMWRLNVPDDDAGVGNGRPLVDTPSGLIPPDVINERPKVDAPLPGVISGRPGVSGSQFDVTNELPSVDIPEALFTNERPRYEV